MSRVVDEQELRPRLDIALRDQRDLPRRGVEPLLDIKDTRRPEGPTVGQYLGA